jgi:hypothetical protein
MANWCNNYLILSGTAAAIEDSVKIFTKIEEEQNRTGKYYLPEFVTAESSNMTDIIVAENTINYQTRWVPNLEALVQIAKHTGVDFASQYDELQMGIIGEATYQNGIFSNIRLDGNDLQQYHYDMDTATYRYNGENYEDEWSVLMKLLENKKAGLKEFQTTNNITKEQLTLLYGELSAADFVLKFAEHKNFDSARTGFYALNNDVKRKIENFLTNAGEKKLEHFANRDKFIAFEYLINLVNEWNNEQRTNHLSR